MAKSILQEIIDLTNRLVNGGVIYKTATGKRTVAGKSKKVRVNVFNKVAGVLHSLAQQGVNVKEVVKFAVAYKKAQKSDILKPREFFIPLMNNPEVINLISSQHQKEIEEKLNVIFRRISSRLAIEHGPKKPFSEQARRRALQKQVERPQRRHMDEIVPSHRKR